MKLVITGATGYLGRNLCHFLSSISLDVIGLTTGSGITTRQSHLPYPLIPYSPSDLSSLLQALDTPICIINAAGSAHLENVNSILLSQAHYNGNYLFVRTLSEALKRSQHPFSLIHLSSLSVLGACNTVRQYGLRVDDCYPASPDSSYSLSKYLAEAYISSSMPNNCTSAISLRLPMVYGTRAPGNYAKLERACIRLPWLPFKSFTSPRSLLHINNFLFYVYSVVTAVMSGESLGIRPPYCISDPFDISLSSLCKYILELRGIDSSNLVHVRPFFLELASRLALKYSTYTKLSTGLLIDPSRFFSDFGVIPPMPTLDDCLSFDKKTIH